MSEKDSTHTSLISFPCDFTIKVFGKESDSFENTVTAIIQEFIVTFTPQAMESRLSENGKYKSLSITIHVVSKEQLDNIYQALSSCPDVLMAL